MNEHPIEGLMKTAMESIREMINISTVVGDAVEVPDGTVIIPVSRVTCGFAAGGSEFGLFSGKNEITKMENQFLPFGGGSGAGVSVKPVGFLVVGHGEIRLMVLDGKNAFIERLIDTSPRIMEQLQGLVHKAEKVEIDEVVTTVDEEITPKEKKRS